MSEFTVDDDPKTKAESLGLDIYEPKPNEVLLDFDEPTDDDEIEYRQTLEMINDALGSPFTPYLVEAKRTVSKSGKGAHVYLTCSRELSNLERVLLQAVLGSDRKREALGFMRITLGSTRPPGVLFELPPGVKPPEPNRKPAGIDLRKHTGDCKAETHYAPCTCGAEMPRQAAREAVRVCRGCGKGTFGVLCSKCNGER